MRTDSPTENRFVTSGGELCWFEWGQPTQAPSLLLLHATGFHGRCWDQVVRALPDGLHIIVPELRGHGRSFKPDTLGDWTAIAADIQELVKGVASQPVFAVGHSLGGYVAAAVAAQAPTSFAGLLLVDPIIMPPDYYANPVLSTDMPVSTHPVSRRRNQWDGPAAMQAHFKSRTPYSAWEEAVLADYCHYGLLPAEHGEGYQLACPPALETSAYLGSAANDPAALLPLIQCPVTVLRAKNGERGGLMDFSNSPVSPDLASRFSHGEDLHWQDLSHLMPMEAPKRIADLIVKRLPNINA